MKYNIALVRGDGIGPEIVDSAVRVLQVVGGRYGHEFICTPYLAGGCAIDETGIPLPEETVKGCIESDSVLLGAVGGPKWDKLPGDIRPEKALLGLRKALGLFTNLRPARIYDALAGACTLRPDIVKDGFDMVIVRELTGGIYFGERGRRQGQYGPEAYDTECYSVMEIERIARVAFDTAMKRRRKLVSIDKANVLETSRLWRKTVERIHAEEYPEVELDHYYVDNAAMQLMKSPKQFDVILTGNMFGDILSDEASQIAGSLGMLPSASLATGNFGMYEPAHGSAPKYTGLNEANPIATIMSAQMMLKYSFNLAEEAEAVEEAIKKALDQYRTKDIMAEGMTLCSTSEIGDRIAENILSR